MTKTKQKSFEENITRIENILDSLNNQQLSLDDSLALFEEGLNCIKECDTSLKKFEAKYEQILSEDIDNGL